MAVDMISESPSLATSPRISFSRDFCQSNDASGIEDYSFPSDPLLLESDLEFDFRTGSSIEAETSSADELFSDGIILPRQLHGRFVHSKSVSLSKSQNLLASLPPLPIPPSTKESLKQETLKETVSAGIESEQKNQSKSFWRINRSSSLHCENSHKKSSFWSLPLLARSNSTGSVPNSKKQTANHKPLKSLAANPASSSLSSSPSISFYSCPPSQKPPLRKNYGGPYGNGVRVSPVLNVPPPCISRGSANFLGLKSLFRNGKDRKPKK